MPHAPKTHRPPKRKAPGHQAPRPSPAQRGYGSHWRRLREWFLRQHPLCADPFGFHAEDGRHVVAEQVDHIVPVASGGTNDEENLQGLCSSCHRRKTVLHDGGSGRAKRRMATSKKEEQ